MRVLSFKVAITIMCKGPLEEKYRCKYDQCVGGYKYYNISNNQTFPNMISNLFIIKPFNNDIPSESGSPLNL